MPVNYHLKKNKKWYKDHKNSNWDLPALTPLQKRLCKIGATKKVKC
jgi:hypothetical protein